MNTFMLLATLVLMLTGALVSLRLGKGYVYAFLATIVTLWIFVAPIKITILGFPLLLTELFFAVLLFTNHLISEHHGKPEAKKAVWVVLFSMVAVGVIGAMIHFLVPANSDIFLNGLTPVFAIAPRLILAVILMYLVEQHLNIWLFHKVKKATKGQKLWKRNLLSTTTTQLVDVLVFYPLAFWGVQSGLPLIMLVALVFKVAVALLDTPFIYWSHKFLPKKLKK